MQNSPGYSPNPDGYYSPSGNVNNPPPNPRNRATTRVTLNVPAEDRRPRTPDTFERDFNSFFQRSAADMFDPGQMPSAAFHPMMMSGGMTGGNPHPMSGFSDFASRHHNPRMMHAFPVSGFQDEFFNPNVFHSPSPKNSPNYYNYPPQYGQAGYQSRGEPMTSHSAQGQNSPNHNQRSPQFSQQIYNQANPYKQMPSPKSANCGNLNGSVQSPTQRDLVDQTANMKVKSADEMKSDHAKGNQGQSVEDSGNVSSNRMSQTDEELRTHGPSYTMFKMDNPQLEISEEFPNRERIRKLSIKKQKDREKRQSLQNQQQEQKQQESNQNDAPKIKGVKEAQSSVIHNQDTETASHRSLDSPSISSVASSEDASPSPRGVVPDWQANVQTGEHFQKRHLKTIRQGHTVHVKAEKTTESVRSGRSTVTREWRVVAPEVVDQFSISAQFDEQEKRLVITGFFDTMHDIEIK
ncbi:uncharacterized protein LOC142339891 [Convolutriloba macropyga]|uniref:uncharacterized protein LOC142339891 n=1 Tax=Convolutriloba macropyga TaxID=536237 RepID=UPI003F526AD0